MLPRRAVLEELATRKMKRESILGACHDMQRKVIIDRSRYKAILAGRRGGKTKLDAFALAIALEESGRDDWSFYSAVTRIVGKDLIWPKLEEVNRDHQLGWEMRSHESVVVTKRGAMFRVLGYDDSSQVEKSAGYRIKLFVADEPHSYASRLKYIAEQKIGPALGDLGGSLMLTGTPGLVRSGYWFDASTGKIPEYKCWKWDARANTKFPRNVDEWFAEELALRKWTWDTPQFRREYLAEWCEDEGQTVYAYVHARNSIEELEIESDGMFTLGVDFGMVDHCAWGVLYSPPMSRDTYVIHTESHGGLLPDQAIDVTRHIVDRYRPSKIVGDAGGLGKPYVEAWNRRYGDRAGMFMHAAEKTEKMANIAITNGELRAGSLKILAPSCPGLIDEITNLVWADERREKEHPACANHICDAALAYGFRAHRGYLHDVPDPPKTTDEQIEAAKWARIQAVQAQIRAREQEDHDY